MAKPLTRSKHSPIIPDQRDDHAPRGWLQRVREFIFGPPMPDFVPNRVVRAVERDQASAEVIITLLQGMAICTFAVLYSLAPKGFPEGVPFEPVPVALFFYALFTGLRLYLALRRRLTPLFLSLSSIVDILVLMVTIWSFHLQYQQPAGIYLKAPTLMYVFILIALRTLRFEPAYVLLCGFVGALGWGVLVIYAVYDDKGMSITRSFAEYAMSLDILLGAEFDKIVSILMVTLILALALHRARRLLVRAAQEEQAVADLSRFFAPEVAGRITRTEDGPSAGDAELREAAIMFIDLRDFTPLSQNLTPAEVMKLLGEYQERMMPIVGKYGGSIDKFMGDGILASFGATRLSESYAADAARALEGVLEAAEIWSREREERGLPAPKAVAVISTGEIMFGTVGDQSRLEYTVIGDPVNLAAKLEKHTKVEKVAALQPAQTMALARAQGFEPHHEWRLIKGCNVLGVEGAIDLFAAGARADV